MKKTKDLKDSGIYSSPELAIIEMEIETAVLSASTEQFIDDEEDRYLNGW